MSDESTSRPTDEVLRGRLQNAWARNKDMKRAFQDWVPKPSPVRLSDVLLWPVLRDKIERARLASGEDIPEIAQIAIDAYYRAQRHRRGTFVLGLADPTTQT